MNYIFSSELCHHGIIGMKWGVRRYQNEDGSLTPKGLARRQKKIEKKDERWTNKNSERIYSRTYNKSKREMNRFVKKNLNKQYSDQLKKNKIGLSYINEYNKKLAEIMNRNVGDIESPSGKIVQFVAKRGDIGVYLALADRGYDMNTVRNGVYDSGRIAYKKDSVNKR